VTDVTTGHGQNGVELSAADEQLLRELTERARAGGLKLTGEGGLLGKLTKMVVEGALEGELDDYLGYGKHEPSGRNGGNSCNGHRAKTVLTDTGPVAFTVPRGRDASFEPKIVAKRQRRLTGIDDMVISLSAKGLTHGEICAHLAEVYGAEVFTPRRRRRTLWTGSLTFPANGESGIRLSRAQNVVGYVAVPVQRTVRWAVFLYIAAFFEDALFCRIWCASGAFSRSTAGELALPLPLSAGRAAMGQ
jgi:hypothetical protein